MPVVADMSFSRIPVAELKQAGLAGIVRYVVGAGKAIDGAEYQSYVAAGFPVALVDERGAEGALSGYAGGQAIAASANAAADALGHPRSRPIFYATEDPTPIAPGNWPTVDAFYDGVASVNGRPAAHYGSGALITHLGDAKRIWAGWEVSTWPGHGSRYSVLRQMAGGVSGMSSFGGAIDHNVVLAGDWGQVPAPVEPPKIGEDLMSAVAYDEVTGGTWTVAPDGAVYTADGAPYLGGLNQHPDWSAGTDANPVVGIAPWKGGGLNASGNGYVIVIRWGADTTGDPMRYYRFPRVGVPDLPAPAPVAGVPGPAGPQGPAGKDGKDGRGALTGDQAKDLEDRIEADIVRKAQGVMGPHGS